MNFLFTSINACMSSVNPTTIPELDFNGGSAKRDVWGWGSR
jgi:hypothetical protein